MADVHAPWHWKQRLRPVAIRAKLAMPASTVHAVLVRCRLNRLYQVESARGLSHPCGGASASAMLGALKHRHLPPRTTLGCSHGVLQEIAARRHWLLEAKILPAACGGVLLPEDVRC